MQAIAAVERGRAYVAERAWKDAYSFSSMSILGAGRDAEHVAKRIVSRDGGVG